MNDPKFFEIVTQRPDPDLTPETCPCSGCGRAGPRPEPFKGPITFTVKQTMGVAMGHTKGLDRVDFS